MQTSPESVAQAFVRAINRQSVDELASLMAPEHLFVDSLGNTVQGAEKMRAGWAAYFKLVPDYTIAVEEMLSSGPVVILLGIAQGTYSTDGNLKRENAWRTPAAIRVQIDNGLVSEWRVYADNEPIREFLR